MADETEMTSVEMTPVAGEPPKVNPLGNPGASEAKTLKLAPPVRRPAAPGATVAASPLKPGLKLPPKPGLATGGLKLPPKPGLATGLKLPPKPGATVAARPLPKPGSTVAARPLPKPLGAGGVRPLPKPIAPASAAPAPAAPAAAPAPAAPVVPVDAQGVGKLPTVSAKTIARDDAAAPAAAEAVNPLEALKTVTQKLKGVTQPIPQQAILHKTGIIADSASTEAQKEAAKHKTARISLSDAMGVAPVKSEPAPMKTIRIKRPVNLPGSSAAPAAPAPAAPAEGGETPAETSVTQRKTLKITRPGTAVRPAGKFGVKKPAAQATTVAAKPAAANAEPAGGEVADIPDIPDLPPVAPVPVAAAPVDTTPGWVTTLSVITGAAAVVAVGALAWFLYQNATLPTFCGGLGWGS